MRNSIIALGIVSLVGLTLAGCGGKSSAFKYVVVCNGEDYSDCGERYLTAGYIEGPAPARAAPAPQTQPGLQPK